MTENQGETSDNYAGVVAVLDGGRRVITCCHGIQWILQERIGGRWRNRSFCQTRHALIRCCGGSNPALDALPVHIKGLPVAGPSTRPATKSNVATFNASLGAPLIVPDGTYPNMFRLLWAGGRLSDIASITRIKAAARAQNLKEHATKGSAGSPVRQSGLGAPDRRGASSPLISSTQEH